MSPEGLYRSQIEFENGQMQAPWVSLTTTSLQRVVASQGYERSSSSIRSAACRRSSGSTWVYVFIVRLIWE
jgi:hypothetical protein